MVKFDVGTKVNKDGYREVVTKVRNNDQRYVRLASGEVVVNVRDLKYWKKKK